ncbi:DUF2190 family protein [Pelosinus sp. UFO1]|uniref:DUF2190 family protein n=1 Tax=Pelosinus sp. UFO1 TaxID=484770 RepID=UPI0004D1D440|nr:DUF2190 family protein [Pelosinus sp. UFO1]AIF52007.1 protein of unknown function UCP030771 [Pelosinus sp. UFO1]
MAKEFTFMQDDRSIDYTATADIVVGQVIPLGKICGIALTNIANGATGAVLLEGIGTCPSATGVNWGIGDELFWDDTANKITNVSTSNTHIGYAMNVKATADTTATVLLNY